MKSTKSMRWQLLKSGATVPIKPGDICSLLKDKCWFKVVLMSDTMESNEEHASKRKALTAVDCDLPCKKPCSESGEGDVKVTDEMINMNKENLLNNEAVTDVAVRNIKEPHCTSSTNEDKMHALNVKLICMPESTDQSSSLVQAECKLQDTNEIISKNITSKETPAIRREKCKYGKKCYRRNLQHKAEFCHPEDPDYDIPDDRKECPYGMQCYRKNLQHTMEYKHIVSSESRKYRKKTPTRVPSSTLSNIEDLSTDESEEESIEESEYDPSDDAEYSSDDEQLFEFLDDS
ncbi:aprataxin and PNK-like factor [Hylaeus anthracinus]|uniref:aprataxin and PNK-like factor n=1 Tax=Hylaeus anthracinus TaxID=313031 RepID=UPI0023BA07A8|nr:aprataxin and PNK-like factor [Hylaeus anthracinus]